MNLAELLRKNVLVITLHLAGLLLYVFSPLFFGTMRNPRFENLQLTLILHNALIAAFFYLNMLVLIPFLLKRRGWLGYVMVAFAFAITFALISHYIREAFLAREPGLLAGALPRVPPPEGFRYVAVSFPYLMAWVFSTSVRFSMDYFYSERKRKERDYENLKSELSLLRSQISPHFMFNVLNSLTALARKKSDELEPTIIKLSQLMRYTIYHSAVPSEGPAAGRVELQTELEYLQNYIDLQTLRFGKHVSVNFTRNLRQHDYSIEPVLLISFVENAFKHGATVSSDPTIDIKVECADDILMFIVRNKFIKSSSNDDTHGVGLRNVKRRLELLYGGKYELDIREEEPWFNIKLTLRGK